MFYQRILLLEPPPGRGRAVRRRALNAWRLIPKSKRDIGGNVGRACSTREARFPALLTPPGPPSAGPPVGRWQRRARRPNKRSELSGRGKIDRPREQEATGASSANGVRK